ncbi:hypothetical protein DM806_25915 [Sphingobium lactosutens]|uniref:type IV toxin-antitoxin system AbiEi family antitoxin domain-containing protein n=1 Tax=Sphingobium lactosutens TaxID=522773 RepID=UPI0015BC6182|nr:type IV toxin-antitoxin system AbiEi family antitoxin domain-containing protein [Sphingobium lactosutens]NWK99031.1 hypothetical protein [Sphingobium lactosutens]
MKSGRALNRRNVHEKQVIAYLRGSGAFELRNVTDGRQAFASLIAFARNRGVAIFPPGARFISDGEVELLANLAAAQRQAGRAFVDVDEQEFEALLRCATVLLEAGIRLPMAGLQCVALGLPESEKMLFTRDRPATGIARARALSLVRSREVASTNEFFRIGVSRQYVSRLCKDGLIQRIRHGWYRAMPIPPRGPSDPYLHA